MRKLLFTIVATLLLSAGNVPAQNESLENYNILKNLDLFNLLYKYLDVLYVDTLNSDETIGAAIHYMLATLDPYTEYYSEKDQNGMKEMLTGKFAGIGAMLKYHRKLKETVIDEPSKDMPADQAGLKKGDIILAVNGEKMHGKPISEVTKRIRGDAGTVVNLKIRRPSTGKTFNRKITRRTIQTPALAYFDMLDATTGYIELTQFNENCSKEVRSAVIDLKKRGMQKLVLDLRNNTGGAEMEAVELLSIFLPKGTLVVTNKGKHEQSKKEYRTLVEPIDTVMPIVVMVNGETASSAEITSGALQDLDRAVILGQRTYGKGLVQTVVDLPYNSSLKLTISKYYTPSGRCIQARNYSHGRRAATEHIPDSLTREFRTTRGRIVRDAGGITPDTIVHADSMTNIAYYLAYSDSTETLHDYVVEYIARHPSIGDAKTFRLSDEEYQLFCNKVMENGFTYDRETEKLLQRFVEMAKFEGYYDDTKEEIGKIEKKLRHDTMRDLQYNKEQISHIIALNIVPTYHYQDGANAISTGYDRQIKAAKDIINDQATYQRLLSPAPFEP